jgi:hypothetical protein
METVLKDKTCFICGFKFKVVDLRNWVCNKCYHHEIPKYTSEARRKKLKNVSFGRFAINDDELIALLIEEARETGNVKTAGEKKYRDFICASLAERGMAHTTELSCDNGRIDIFINGIERERRGHYIIKKPPKIIEVKISDSSSHMTAALGQLLFYSQSYPQAQLYVATPQHLTQKVRKIFGIYKIEEWPENKTDAWRTVPDAVV